MKAILENSAELECEDAHFAEGGAGFIHRAQGGASVIKVYKGAGNELRTVVNAAVHDFAHVAAPPYWNRYFVWPDAIVLAPGFGVRMPHLPAGFFPLARQILAKSYNALPRAEKSWLLRCLWGLRTARPLGRMHRCGLGNGDVSCSNVAVSLDGSALLMDTDTPVVPSVLPAQVMGTLNYMAPELHAGTAMPSIKTDLHALAVLLHELLLFRHPLRGPKVHSQDPDEDEWLALGERALFIDHPTDGSNRPKKDFWPTTLLGEELTRLFRAALVDGLRKPEARPTAGAWEEALVRLVDRVVPCASPTCEQQWFPATPGEHPRCPWCGTSWPRKASLPWFSVEPTCPSRRRGPWWVAANDGRTLHEWHRRMAVMPGPDAPVDAVGAVYRDHDVWRFTARKPGVAFHAAAGHTAPLLPGYAIPLTNGLTFTLGDDADLCLRVKL